MRYLFVATEVYLEEQIREGFPDAFGHEPRPSPALETWMDLCLLGQQEPRLVCIPREPLWSVLPGWWA